ncbi:MAG: hypothetical protein QOF24_3105 [Verrucomicrobiota bacterium]
MAGLLGAVAAIAFTFWPRLQPPAFYFAITMRSELPGFARLYYDTPSAVDGSASIRLPIQAGNAEATYKFPLTDGRYANLRFEPTDQSHNTIVLSRARIVDRGDTLLRAIPLRQIKASSELDRFQVSETEVTLTTSTAHDHPMLILELGRPVILKNAAGASVRTLLRRFLVSFLISSIVAGLTVPLLLSRVGPVRWYRSSEVADWIRTHPSQVVLATAALAVALSCYPIVFFGKSFLSPNNHSQTFLLYGEMPTVPGSTEAATDDQRGADLGAAMWYSWPVSVVESRSLFRDCELPLWNRYDFCGVPLLGQGQSMFGDPLHLLVLLTNGSVGWWDLKYLLAKFIFATCVGLCVLQLTRHLPAAAIITASSTFIGFFSYRYAHPAFFSFCYAPAILLCWLKLKDSRGRRTTAAWLAVLVLADWCVINSGTVKDAYILLPGINLAGCLTLLLARGVVGKGAKLCQALSAQVLFILIAAPIWITFLHTLRSSWTYYGTATVFQLQPSLFLGLFDDIFYRQFNKYDENFDPSSNFVILGAVLWFCLSQQEPDSRRLSWGVGITCLFALAVTFGVVPPSFLIRLPFLGNIHHVDNAFSSIAILCLLVIGGFGIQTFWSDCRAPDFKRTYLRVLACLAGLLAVYLGTTEAVQRSTKTWLQIGEHIPKSNFFWGYSALLVLALAVAPVIGRLVISNRRGRSWQICLITLIFVLLHWRHGMHLITPFDSSVMNPQVRTKLTADFSPALALIHNGSPEPFRAVGFGNNLYPGYGGAIAVEQIDGMDPLLNKYYRSLMDAYGVRFVSSHGDEGVIDNQLGTNLPLTDMLNLRYFLGEGGTKAAAFPSLKKIATLDLDVYESTKVWSRAFFSDRLIAYDAEQDFVRLLKTGPGLPFAAIAKEELESRPELRDLATTPKATPVIVPATHYALTNNTTSFKVTAPGPGVVVLTEPYVEGDFQLRVNGRASSYFRVNSAFRGVFLPGPGEYDFSFRYWPRYFTISLCLSGFGILMFALWLGIFLRNSSRCE